MMKAEYKFTDVF